METSGTNTGTGASEAANAAVVNKATLDNKGTGKQASAGHESVIGEAGQAQESAVDRAMARKKAADDQERAEKREAKASKKKINSLADLRKLHSSKVAPEELKHGDIEVDGGALPNPRPPELERGRPEPKVKTQTKVQHVEQVEEETPETDGRGDIETAQVEEGQVAEASEEAQTEEYKPNLKFKAYGKEHDIPELFHSLITSPETERAVHEVFEKSQAFEKTKAAYANLERVVSEQIYPELEFYRNVREDLNDFAGRGDVFGLLGKFGFDERKVLQAAAERVSLLEASPEVRAMHEGRERAEALNRESARRLAALERKSAESDRLAKRLAFESTLARGDVAAVAQEFDQKMGKPGSFGRMVAQHAHQVYLSSVDMAQSGRGRVIDLTPEQAVQDFMRVYGLSFPDVETVAADSTPARQAAKPVAKATATQAQKPKIIPNIGSRAASTTDARPVFKTARDIANYRKQRFGR